MRYDLSEEAREILKDLRHFCKKEVEGTAREADRKEIWPEEMYRKALESGYGTLELPEELGGPGLTPVETGALLEEMAAADAGFAVTMAASWLGLTPILLAGTEEQKKQAGKMIEDGGLGCFCLTEPEAGSDAGAGRTRAEKCEKGYILNGRKCFITNGSRAAFYCVTAMTEPEKGTEGMTMFLVEAGTKGLKTGALEDKMGIRTSDTCEVILSDCFVPFSSRLGEEGEGFKIAMKTLDRARAFMAAAAVGVAERCTREAVAYAGSRKQFGKPIFKHQAVGFKIADMEIRTEMARQMTAYALDLIGKHRPHTKEAAIAKCAASDAAVQNALEAIQIFGGYGYSREYPVEKLLRDAKIFQIFEGTNEIQRMVICGKTIAEKTGD